MPTPHRTARERAAQASAAAAVARALAHTRPPPPETDNEQLSRLYPYVTPARAQAIRHEIKETRHA